MLSLISHVRPKGDPRVVTSGPSSLTDADRLARGLGWFSLGLGVVQLIAPRLVTRPLGLAGAETLVRAFGAREIASGVLVLSTERSTGMASRVVGDALDLMTLAAALGGDDRRRGAVKTAFAVVAGIALLDLAVARSLARIHGRGSAAPRDYSDRSGFPGGKAGRRGGAHRGTDPRRSAATAPGAGRP